MQTVYYYGNGMQKLTARWSAYIHYGCYSPQSNLACFHYRPLIDIVFWACNILKPSGRKKWGGPSPLSKKWGVRPPPKVTPMGTLRKVVCDWLFNVFTLFFSLYVAGGASKGYEFFTLSHKIMLATRLNLCESALINNGSSVLNKIACREWRIAENQKQAV